jgi:hypothetical protein
MLELVHAILIVAGAYAVAGLAFAAWFVLTGHRRLDDKPMTSGARVLLVPGAAALWPLLLARTVAAGSTRGPMSADRS